MDKISVRIENLMSAALKNPDPMESSFEGWSIALLLAQAAWNRAVDYEAAVSHENFLSDLTQFVERNPNCLEELKGTDYETLIAELVFLKEQYYPDDHRFIVSSTATENGDITFGSIPKNKVRQFYSN